jgi:hypothetical protein
VTNEESAAVKIMLIQTAMGCLSGESREAACALLCDYLDGFSAAFLEATTLAASAQRSIQAN